VKLCARSHLPSAIMCCELCEFIR